MILPKLPVIPGPYKLLGAVVLCLAFFGYGYYKGVQITENKQAAKELEDLVKVQEERDSLEAELRTLESKRQENEVETRVVYRNIERKIDDATDDRICFTSDSLSLWNEAIAGKSTVPKDTAAPAQIPGAADSATDKDILQNAVANFEIAQRYRQQIIDIIEADKVIHGEK